MKVDH